MPPLGNKGKSKGVRDARSSLSRNTTPSSVVSAPLSATTQTTAYLDIPVSSLSIPTSITYDDILERHGGSGGIPDPKHLEALANDLKKLSQMAETRGQACDGGMRELASRRKERVEEEREKEQAKQEAEEKENLKRAAEEDEESRSRKAVKPKKRKERSSMREERPLAHGAHGIPRQDGIDVNMKDVGTPSPAGPRKSRRGEQSPPLKDEAASRSSSSLSPASQLQSPVTTTQPAGHGLGDDSEEDSDSEESHQPPPAPSVPQNQIFGSDPLTFDDPTLYHIREVTADMTDEEKKEIYGVAQFPHDDLRDLIAGTPPDKDFSNAKPASQVNANTFATYIEPYLRPLTEEDMAFLKERGDRVTPFLMPRRGKRHYTEVWAEEDGVSIDTAHQSKERLPPNQPRGNIEQMDDATAETEQISAGPLLSRLMAAMRPEHRPSPFDDKDKQPNGLPNGESSSSAANGLLNLDANGDITMSGLVPEPSSNTNLTEENKSERLPPATFMPESAQPTWKVPATKLDYAQVDERLKAELRHIGFIGPEEEPDYDAHYDDDVAARLRTIQAELKRVSIINAARKARNLQVAQDRLAYQEYRTVLDDLDSQVQQAYLKRTRTLGKGKKNTKRPGGAGGGSHYVGGAAGASSSSGAAGGGPGGSAAGVTKPGIGDVARTLMERRRHWMDAITPIFTKDTNRVRSADESIFEGPEMERLIELEKEKWDEEDLE